MNSHDPWMTVVLAAVAAWWVVISCGLVLRRTAPPPVTLDVTPMSRPRAWLPGPQAAAWRALSWLAFVVGLDGMSLRAAQRAERIGRRERRRARDAERQSARALAWDQTHASSPCSPWTQRLPPSAPRQVLPEETEETRRWERTLPWGTPSPLLTREGMGKPYPFVPLADPPQSSGTAYRSPPRTPRRPPPPIPSLPRTPRQSAQ